MGLTVGQCATLACLLEVSAPKPGNVHRGADFEDASFIDFGVSAVAIAPAMEQARVTGVGVAVLSAVRATRWWVHTNTNLGTVLLLAPLAAVPDDQSLSEGVGRVLENLTPADSAAVYQAIRLTQPGGLGRVSTMDVAGQSPVDLRQAMHAAAERDLVARQYVNDFSTVLHEVVPMLLDGRDQGWPWTDVIIHCQLQLLSRYGDSLIARKCGQAMSRAVADRAASVLAAGEPGNDNYLAGLADLDFWLRSDHHQRNPGTTADLIAAGLFAALRQGQLQPPF